MKLEDNGIPRDDWIFLAELATYAAIIVAVILFIAHFDPAPQLPVAAQTYKECMREAGKNYWKRKDCKDAQAPAR